MATELIRVSDPGHAGLMMVASPAEQKRRIEELQAFIKEAMEEGIDYGTIPGTDKPTLFQPGAQKLSEFYGLAASFAFDVQTEDWDRPFFYYRVVCSLTERRSGCFVGMGIGSCNSREKKYAGRWVPETDAPSWLDVSKLKHREAMTWLWKSKLPPGVEIEKLPTQVRTGSSGPYTVYGVRAVQVFVPNEEIPDLVNTLQKMAIKRALVGAVNGVTRSSGIFSQDVEDLPPEALGYVDSRRPWERDDEPPHEPPAERADVAAAREKLQKQAAAKKGAAPAAAASAPAASAPAASAPTATAAPTPTAFDPAKATPAEIVARLDAEQVKSAFTATWSAAKVIPGYAEPGHPVYEAFARNRLRLWPNAAPLPTPATTAPAAAPAPTSSETTAPQAPAAAAAPDPKMEKWLGEITRAGGNEHDDVWNALNDAYDGEIPGELLRAFEARWPTEPAKVDAATGEVTS